MWKSCEGCSLNSLGGGAAPSSDLANGATYSNGADYSWTWGMSFRWNGNVIIDAFPTPASGNIDVYIAGAPSAPWKINVSINNPSPVPKLYRVRNQATGDWVDGGSALYVPPGGTAAYSFSGDEKIPIEVVPYWTNPVSGQDEAIGQGNISIPTTDSHWVQSNDPPPTSAPADDDNYQGPNVPGSEWFKIGWPSDNPDLARDQTLQTGFDVLYSQLQAGQKEALDLMRAQRATSGEGNEGLGAVNDQLAAIKADTAAIKSDTGSANTKLQSLVDLAQALGTTANAISSSVNTAATGISANGAKLDALRGDVGDVTAAVNAAKAAIDTVAAGNGNVVDAVNSVRTAVLDTKAVAETMDGRLSEIASDASLAANYLDVIEGHLGTQTGLLTTGNANTGGIRTDIQNQTFALDNALDALLTSLNNFASANNLKLTELGTKIDESRTAIVNSETVTQGLIGQGNSELVELQGAVSNGAATVSSAVQTAKNELQTGLTAIKNAIDASAQGVLNFKNEAHQDSLNHQAKTDNLTNWIAATTSAVNNLTNYLQKYPDHGGVNFEQHYNEGIALGNSQMTDLKNQADELTAKAGSVVVPVSGGASVFAVAMPAAFGGGTVNLDPRDNDGLAAFMPYFRSLAKWVVVIAAWFAFFRIWKDFAIAIHKIHSGAGLTEQVPGTGIITKILSHVAIKTIIAAAFTALPLLWTTVNLGWYEFWADEGLLASAHPIIAESLTLANWALPMTETLSAALSLGSSMLTCATIYHVRALAIRFVPGA